MLVFFRGEAGDLVCCDGGGLFCRGGYLSGDGKYVMLCSVNCFRSGVWIVYGFQRLGFSAVVSNWDNVGSGCENF